MHKDQYIQSLRGLAISAVVLIHSLPGGGVATLLVRPFLNFAVAMFIFLSGSLTSQSKVRDWKKFYKHRLTKIIFPYLVWTAIYLLISRNFSCRHIVLSLILGTSAAQMYFLIVYMQLVLVTPIIMWIRRTKYGFVLYIITPLTLLVREVCACTLSNSHSSIFASFFGTWLIFYLVGLDYREKKPWILWCTHHAAAVCGSTIAFIGLQLGAAFWWNHMDMFDVATSQLKLSAMLTSLGVVIGCMSVSPALKTWCASNKILTWLGDTSFGVYLAHIVILQIFRKVFVSILGIPLLIACVPLWLFTLLATALIVTVGQRILAPKICLLLGFE